MSVDTKEKRSSVWEIPGLMTNPYPDGTDRSADRQQMNDLYAGIPTAAAVVPPNETCWHPSISNGSTWKSPSTLVSSWKNEQKESQTWKSPQVVASSWVKPKSTMSTTETIIGEGVISVITRESRFPRWKKEDEIEACQE